MKMEGKVLEFNVPEFKSRTIPLLSVIIPVSQMSGRLGPLEQWLVKTENLPIEIILIHDYQDESTSKELNVILQLDKNLKINFLEGYYGSPGAARNAGLNLPLGTWVAFWDSDDIPKVDQVISAIYEAPETADLIIGNFIASGSNSRVYLHEKMLEIVALNPGIWRMIFKSKLLHNSRFENLRMGEDQLFILGLDLPTKVIHFSNRTLYEYRVGHPGQLTAKLDAIQDIERTLIKVRFILENNQHLRNKFSRIIEARIFITSLRNVNRNRLKVLLKNVTPVVKSMFLLTQLIWTVGPVVVFRNLKK